MCQRGKLPVNRLMGEQLGLQDINRAFNRMVAGAALHDLVLM